MLPRRWKFAPPQDELSAQIALHASIPPLLAHCLASRGCGSPAEAVSFLDPRLAHLSDPFLLPNMNRAVERLIQARQSGERLVIFGDYDVDGVTATAILSEFLQTLGWHSSHYLPHRIDEGYGLTRDAVENCLRKCPATLLLAVDCGSTACEVVRNLQSRGVDVIILDHHQFADPAPALALVNPHLQPGKSPCRDLCSAGLAFKLAHALLKQARALDWPGAHGIDLKQWLDLAALGTIADMVPLSGENRILARAGLRKLAETSRPGLAALKKVAGVNGSINATHVGFQLGPRLNAAGRLETALDALDLLLCQDSARAEELAGALDLQNRERQAIERSTADRLIAGLRSRFNPATDYVIVEGEATWHIGVAGIVASRVLREFHRPTIILGGDGSEEWRGSGRSIEGFDLAGALRECGDLLLKHGGHAMAAGVTLSPPNLVLLRERLNALVKSAVTTENLQPTLPLDAEVRLDEITFPLVKQMERLEPFGQGNPPVQLACRNLQARSEPRRLGKQKQHCKFAVSDGSRAHQVVWWNCPEELSIPPRFDLAFSPELNEYNGTHAIQLKALDLRAS